VRPVWTRPFTVAALVTYDIVSTHGRFFGMDTVVFDKTAQSLLDSV
jgi:hypothetical protein